MKKLVTALILRAVKGWSRSLGSIVLLPSVSAFKSQLNQYGFAIFLETPVQLVQPHIIQPHCFDAWIITCTNVHLWRHSSDITN